MSASTAPILEAHRVGKTFGGGLFQKGRLVALDELSLRIDEEDPSIIAVVGESGSGKTTLARLLLGLVAPTTGQVRYRGTDLDRLSPEQRRTFLRDVQVIFQDPFEVYNPFYKVDHVLELPITNFKLAATDAERRRLMAEVLEAVGLRPEETLGRYPHQLSGGQRQRIMVARALLLRPRVIIADEPVSMVDASLRATILETLRTLNREFGISIVYITHDLTTAYQISHDMVVLYRGRVAELGNVETIVGEPQHPYTRLLVNSIPLPNPDLPWQGERALGRPAGELAPRGADFCPFHDRCPHTMPLCVEQAPPIFQTAPDRGAACFLYREAPALDTDAAALLLGERTGRPRAAAPAAGERRVAS